jgi:hypothetical protein
MLFHGPTDCQLVLCAQTPLVLCSSRHLHLLELPQQVQFLQVCLRFFFFFFFFFFFSSETKDKLGDGSGDGSSTSDADKQQFRNLTGIEQLKRETIFLTTEYLLEDSHWSFLLFWQEIRSVDFDQLFPLHGLFQKRLELSFPSWARRYARILPQSLPQRHCRNSVFCASTFEQIHN